MSSLTEYGFLRIYKDIAEGTASNNNVEMLLSDLLQKASNTQMHEKLSEAAQGDRVDKVIAIDAMAHAIHQGDEGLLKTFYPDADMEIFKSFLDELAGMEIESDVRKANRGYFTTIKSTDGILDLRKQAGRTTKEDISDAIEEYKKLLKAGIASPAEILTLYRNDPSNRVYSAKVVEMHLDSDENEPLVVGGPASVEVVDKEGHLITVDALKDAFKRFMANFRTRNSMILHSDVQAGWALPAYINKAGEIFKSEVDDKGLWLISELRNDLKIMQKIKDEIADGKLKSYSIAGSATAVENVTKGMNIVKQVNALDLAEVTLCLVEKTRILTFFGFKNIENIEIGDKVYTHKDRWRSVVRVFEREVNEDIIEFITKNGNKLGVTKNHQIRVVIPSGDSSRIHYGWIKAEKIKIGDGVSCYSEEEENFRGHFDEIAEINIIPYSGKVYNLEVEDDHSYTTEAMVVKNCERGMNPGAHFDILKADLNENGGYNMVDEDKDTTMEYPGKILQHAAGYRKATDDELEKGMNCRNCIFFEENVNGDEHECNLVEGRIDPDYISVLFRTFASPEDVEEELEKEDIPVINVDDTEENSNWLHSMRKQESWEDRDQQPEKLKGKHTKKADTNPYDAESPNMRGKQKNNDEPEENFDMNRSAVQKFAECVKKQDDVIPGLSEEDTEKRRVKLRRINRETGMPDEDAQFGERNPVAEAQKEPWIVNESGEDYELEEEKKKRK